MVMCRMFWPSIIHIHLKGLVHITHLSMYRIRPLIVPNQCRIVPYNHAIKYVWPIVMTVVVHVRIVMRGGDRERVDETRLEREFGKRSERCGV